MAAHLVESFLLSTLTSRDHESPIVRLIVCLFPFLPGLDDSFVLIEFHSTGAGPSGPKLFAFIALFALSFDWVVKGVGVFAETFEVVASVDGDVVEASAFATRCLALDSFVFGFSEVVFLVSYFRIYNL